jgi:hypothetical protein
MRLYISGILVLLIAIMAMGDDAQNRTGPPESPQARDALAKYDATIRRAAQSYYMAAVSADRQKVTDLESALKASMQKGDLPESERIDAAKADAEDELARNMAAQAAGQQPIVAATAWITRVTWLWNGGGDRHHFLPDGTVTCDSWNGKQGTWKPLDANTILLNEPAGPVKVTFSNDHLAALWEYMHPSAPMFAFAIATNE